MSPTARVSSPERVATRTPAMIATIATAAPMAIETRRADRRFGVASSFAAAAPSDESEAALDVSVCISTCMGMSTVPPLASASPSPTVDAVDGPPLALFAPCTDRGGSLFMLCRSALDPTRAMRSTLDAE